MAKKKTNTKKNTNTKAKAKISNNDTAKSDDKAIKEISLMEPEEEIISGSLEALEGDKTGKAKVIKKASFLGSLSRAIVWLVLVTAIALVVFYFLEPKKFDIAKNKLQNLLNTNFETAESVNTEDNNNLIADVKKLDEVKNEKSREEIAELIAKNYKTVPKASFTNINKQLIDNTNKEIKAEEISSQQNVKNVDVQNADVKEVIENKASEKLAADTKKLLPVSQKLTDTLKDTKPNEEVANTEKKPIAIEGLDVTITVPSAEITTQEKVAKKVVEAASLKSTNTPVLSNDKIKAEQTEAVNNNVIVNTKSLEPLKVEIATKDTKQEANKAQNNKAIEETKAILKPVAKVHNENVEETVKVESNSTDSNKTKSSSDAELLEKIAKLESKITYQKKKISQMNEQSSLKIKDLESKLADTAKQRNIALTTAKNATDSSANQDAKDRMLRSVVSLNEQTSVKHIKALAEKIGASNKINAQIKNLEAIKSKETPTKNDFLNYLDSIEAGSVKKDDSKVPEGRALWNKLSNFPSSFVRIRDKKDVEQEKAQKEIVKDISINLLKNDYEMAEDSVSKLNADLYPVKKLTSTIQDIKSREQSINEIKKILGN